MSPAMTLRHHRGFTLIELMITVAIIGILAAIAIPAFDSQTRKSNRAAAQAFMLDVANKQAIYLQSQRSYAEGATALTDLGYGSPTPPPEVAKWYTHSIVANNAGTPPTYTVTLTPVAGTKQVKDGPLVVMSNGTKTRNGNASEW